MTEILISKEGGTCWRMVYCFDATMLDDGYYFKNAGDPPTYIRVDPFGDLKKLEAWNSGQPIKNTTPKYMQARGVLE